MEDIRMQETVISVVICTRNRADSLSRTLESLANCKRPSCQWEVIVVDNGSADNTRLVVERFNPVLPIRYTHESEPGLSRARNCGVRHACGSHIIWTDDDVTFDSCWLVAYQAAFESHPEAIIFGGRIEAEIVGPSPTWFLRNRQHLSDLLVVRAFDKEERITLENVPFGASFALRSDEQRRHLFDPELGVQPGRRRNGEETAVIKALLSSGASGYTVPDAIAYHYTAPARQTLSYVKSYYMASGEENEPTERRAPRFRMIKSYLGYLCRWALGRDWMGSYKNYAYFCGVIRARRTSLASSQ